MGFPVQRPRRLRVSKEMRALVRETTLAPNDLVYPMFFHAAIDEKRPISTMPGIMQHPVKDAAAEAKKLAERGIKSCILFGFPKQKDPEGRSGLDPNGPVPETIRRMKDAVPELIVMADVCVD